MSFPLAASAVTAAALSLAIPGMAVADSPERSTSGSRIEEIHITGAREHRTSRGALVLPVSIYDTPQAVTVVDREFIEDFGLDDVNDLLKLVTGVNVEEVETDRTYYNSRGFDIKSMQVDGVGLPFNWNVVGDLDTVVYDKVEVIRGANGLLTGTGNPSGTINYIRKRPTNDAFVTTEMSGGSWNRRRLEADVSGPLTESGSWAGRVVGAMQSGESYLDHYENERGIVYGILEGQLTERSTLTVGHTWQRNSADGVLWGALPMIYGDGTQTDFSASTSTTMDWTSWETNSNTSFIEATYAFSPNWNLLTTLTYNDYEEPSELFYVYAFPAFDEATGTGLYGFPGNYESTSERVMLDSTLTGGFDAFGRSHEVIVGLNVADADYEYFQQDAPGDDPAWGALPAFPGWTGHEIPRPAFGERVKKADWESETRRLFGVTRLNATEALAVIVGFNAIDYQSDGISFDEPQDASESEVSPYMGATYALTDNVNVYASYSDIYEPQPEIDASLRPLGAAEGTSMEAGLKSQFFDDQLLTTIAIFRAEQDNYAEYSGFDTESGLSYYHGIDVDSTGFELEAAGRINDVWTLQAGYTYLELENPDGDDVRTFVPRKTFTLGTRYAVAALAGLEFGGTLKWQDDIELPSGPGVIHQDDYALASAFVSYEFLEHFEVAFNVNNLTDEKYLTSLYWDQSFYAAPRNVTATLRVRY
jgi:outer membrane receptor for ferric coprogen and ferric-rhodotorulic acid